MKCQVFISNYSFRIDALISHILEDRRHFPYMEAESCIGHLGCAGRSRLFHLSEESILKTKKKKKIIFKAKRRFSFF